MLLPSIYSFDRGDKFNDYRTLESLQEYVLVGCQHRRVEIFRRHTDGLCLFQIYDGSGTFLLDRIDYTGTFAMLYEDMVIDGSDRDR